MTFKPGTPKPVKSGRKKGSLNKRTVRLQEALEDRNCNLADELAKAIIAKDVEMVKALKGILEFIFPKVSTTQPDEPPTIIVEANKPIQPTPEELTALIKLASTIEEPKT